MHMRRQSLFCHTVASLAEVYLNAPRQWARLRRSALQVALQLRWRDRTSRNTKSPLRAGFFTCYKFATASARALLDKPFAYHSIP